MAMIDRVGMFAKGRTARLNLSPMKITTSTILDKDEQSSVACFKLVGGC